jgi:polyferredoxin
MFLSLEYPAGVPLGDLYLAADPLLAVASSLFHMSVWLPLLLPAAGLLLASVLAGRAFCGWACPVGFLADLSGRFARQLRRKPFGRLGYLQYGVLIALLLASLLAIDALSLLDPLVIFQRSLYLLWSFSGLPAILLLIMAGSLLAPRLWCRICPMGGVLGLASLASPFGRSVNDKCTKCLKCRRACPMGAISEDNRFDATACVKCLDCERACPEDAISFAASRPSVPSFMDRRAVLAAGASLGLLAIAKAAFSTSSPSLIRPPGSLVESKFNSACVRCESCAKACLGGAIRPAGLDAGLERAFTPALDFNRGKCERCGTCGAVCPTGAIISTPETNMRMGTARLDRQRCIAWAQGKKCLICAEVCPVHAVGGTSDLRPSVDAGVCVGCGSCQYNCPAEGKAIVVSSEGERRHE